MQGKELITPQQMLQDNHSEAAGQNMQQIIELREKGELMVIHGCSDARIVLPNNVYQVRTIAGTGPRSPWTRILNYEKARGVIILDHFDCGGIKAHAQLPENIEDEDTALGFVKDHVWSDDPVVQSILTGSWTASRTQKPVMSAVQNHLDGVVYAQAVYRNGDQTEHKTIPTYKLMPNRYVQEEIYGSEVPQLRGSLIPPSFAFVLAEIRDRVESLRSVSPDFAEQQAVQDPQVVAVTTNIKPLSARFPALFNEPNTVFQVSLKRQSLEDEGALETRDVREAFRQVHYPLSYAIENNHQSQPGRAPFASTRVLYLETGDMRDSIRLAKQARRRPVVQQWLELPGRTIIVAEAIAGKVTEIEVV